MLYMQKTNTTSSYRILLAISVAILFHTLLGIALFQILPEIETKKTIPVQVVISSKPTSSAIQTQANNPSNKPEETAKEILNKEKLQNASKEFITTTSTSNTRTNSAKENTQGTDTKTTPNESSKSIKQENIFIPKIKTDLPDARRDIAISSKSQAASKSFTEIAALFRQREEMKASVTQLSSNPELPVLSEYETKLFEKLTNPEFHDRLYPIISKLRESKILTLELILFSNGSLKNALVKKSSGHKILDQAVRRIALDASPYPPPPKEDKSQGFKYRVSIRYNPISNNR